jgi:multidrug efflux pump subunit AcrA (membrane-fusion protein)
VSAAPQAATDAARPAETEGGRPPRRRLWVIAGLVVLVLGAGTFLAITRPFGGGGGAGGGIDNGSPTSLASVTRRSLASRINVNGTLGYAGSYDVVNQATGTLSALPAVGDLIEQGDVLYRVDGSPVVLLEGSTPAYRVLVPGMAGPDVRQLNAALVDLGYASKAELDPTSDRFDWDTSRALRKLQAHVGLEPTGILLLGQAVFLPSGVRVTGISATLGTTAQAGTSILSATSTARRVHIDLDAAQQSQVKEGDKATITMPDDQTTPGVVSKVGKVATTPSDSSGSGDSSPTIPVVVTPTHPSKTGQLDQAPVLVSITTATVKNALVVPVDALIALSGGGYAVEVDSGGSRRLVPVTLGMFDDAEGLVQVSGSGLREGQRVVVPAS